MQVFRYISPGLWSVDLGQAAVRLGTIGLTTNAELGSVGISTIAIDNPSLTVGHNADNIVAWKQFAVDELASGAGDQRIYMGLIGDRTYRRGRGPTSSLRTGAGGIIDVTISDLNALLTLRIVTGTDGVRPAETVAARLTWLLASAYLTGLVYDNGLIAANTTMLDPVDFRGQRAHDVLGDLATIAHYNFFVYFNEANGQASLWFDEANLSATYDSGMTISNVLADINQAAIVAGTATTFYALDDAQLLRSSAAIYSGAYITYAKGGLYLTNAATATAFTARDGSAPNANLKTLATATTTANTFLTDSATEDDRITCTIAVAAAQANAIKAGQLVQVKFSHLPGYTAATLMRVTKRSAIIDDAQRDRYKLRLEMTPATPLSTVPAFAALLRCGGGAGALFYNETGDTPAAGWFPEPQVGDLTIVQGASPYSSIRAGLRGLVRVELIAEGSGVGPLNGTITLNATRNGSVIGSATVTLPGGFWNSHLVVDLHNVIVNVGDIISFSTETSVGVNPGWGNTSTTYLRVGRGTFVWNAGTVTWVGP